MLATALAVALSSFGPVPATPVRTHCRRANYRCRFRRLPAGWRRWAHRTAECESHHIATIHDPSGTYHGAFQFSLSTWQAAGGQGDPHVLRWAAQGFRAVHLAKTSGTQHWPNCG